MGTDADERDTGKRTFGKRCQHLLRENKLLVLLICLIAFGIVVGTLLVCIAPTLLRREAGPYRLPNNIVPYHYDLEIKPYLIPEKSKFEGEIEIYVTCAKTTDLIILHSKDLEINEDSVKVTRINDGKHLKVLSIYYDTSNQLLFLRLLEDLKERRRYRIYIKYGGVLKSENDGFYISTYEDDRESTHYIASTDFEPDQARMAFPCFDEPAYKSTFNITLVRWKNTTSLSNMPKYRTEHRGKEWDADIYLKSMRMSTYLVAFVFCDYVGRTKGKITVWSPAHRKEDAEYALNMSVKFLKYFEEKLQIPYAAPKLDMVPVGSLSSLAMENWGLIIYQESHLLTSDKAKTEKEKFSLIATTVAHEIAHQWFGNLVTPKWWSDIWLSEGISSYMTDLAVIELFPEMAQVDPSMVKADYTIEFDCSASVPLLNPVASSEEAKNNFNTLTYVKGSLITRMAHKILEDTVFWKGINRYLSSNSYENVEEADLWRFLTMAQSSSRNKLDMAEIMHPWTHLSGVPIVTIERNYDRRTATISQESCELKKKEHANDVWNIPLKFKTKYVANYFNTITWLKTKNMTREGMPRKDEWIVVTNDLSGYYLVNYDQENWNLLSEQVRLNHEIFDASERYRLLQQILYFEGKEYYDADLVFQYFLYLKEEREFEVFVKSLAFIIGYLEFFDQNRYYDLFREYVIYIWKDIYHRFDWKEEENILAHGNWESIAGIVVTKVLCKLRYTPCVKEAISRYSTLKITNETGYLNYTERVPLCTFVENATVEEWKKVKEAYFTEGESLLFVMQCSKNAAVIREEFSALIKEPSWSIIMLLTALSSTTEAFREFMDILDDHFEKFIKEFSFGEHLHSMVKRMTVNSWRIEKVLRVFSKHGKNLSGANAEDVDLLLEVLKEKLQSTDKKTEVLKKWLEKKPWIQRE